MPQKWQTADYFRQCMVHRMTAGINLVERQVCGNVFGLLMEPRAPGQDEFRCVSVLTSRAVVETIIGNRFQTRRCDCSFVLTVPVQIHGRLVAAKAWSALDRCSQTVPKPGRGQLYPLAPLRMRSFPFAVLLA
jgi:hypothetical protein